MWRRVGIDERAQYELHGFNLRAKQFQVAQWLGLHCHFPCAAQLQFRPQDRVLHRVSRAEEFVAIGGILHVNSHLAVTRNARMRARWTRYPPKRGDMDFAGRGAGVTGGETQPIVAAARRWEAKEMTPRMCSRSRLRRGRCGLRERVRDMPVDRAQRTNCSRGAQGRPRR